MIRPRYAAAGSLGTMIDPAGHIAGSGPGTSPPPKAATARSTSCRSAPMKATAGGSRPSNSSTTMRPRYCSPATVPRVVKCAQTPGTAATGDDRPEPGI